MNRSLIDYGRPKFHSLRILTAASYFNTQFSMFCLIIYLSIHGWHRIVLRQNQFLP
jgi:hypothetical protein